MVAHGQYRTDRNETLHPTCSYGGQVLASPALLLEAQVVEAPPVLSPS